MNILIKLINDVKATLALIKAKTDTITADLFTATHASRIDANISSRQANAGLTTTHASRIDASISSRADQATANAIKAKTDLITTGGSMIKGVQRGFVSIVYVDSLNCYTDVTISAVNLSKTFVNVQFGKYGIGTEGKYLPASSAGTDISGRLVNSTTLRLTSGGNGGTCAWEVIEFM